MEDPGSTRPQLKETEMSNWTKQDNTKIGKNVEKNLGKCMPGMKSTIMRYETYQRFMKENHVRVVPKIKNPIFDNLFLKENTRRKHLITPKFESGGALIT